MTRDCKAGECYQPAYCDRQGECGSKLPDDDPKKYPALCAAPRECHCGRPRCRSLARRGEPDEYGRTFVGDTPDPTEAWQPAPDDDQDRFRYAIQGSKPTNPKDALGIARAPLHLIPAPAMAEAALAHLDGAIKYGPFNWRSKGVMASVYASAAIRHIERWFNGLDYEPVSGAHELGHAIAGLNILIDAIATGNMIDDRPEPVDMDALFEDINRRAKERIERGK